MPVFFGEESDITSSECRTKPSSVGKWTKQCIFQLNFDRIFFLATHANDLKTIEFILDNLTVYHVDSGEPITLIDLHNPNEPIFDLLENAAWLGRTEIVEMILNKGVPADTNNDGPLKQAVQQGHVETAKLLRSRGAKHFNQSSVGMAMMNGHVDMIRWLSQESPGEFSWVRSGCILTALKHKHFEIVKTVLDCLIKEELSGYDSVSNIIRNIWTVIMVHTE